jgi:hypothetical protein
VAVSPRVHDRLLHAYLRVQALGLVPLYLTLAPAAWAWGRLLYPPRRCCCQGG